MSVAAVTLTEVKGIWLMYVCADSLCHFQKFRILKLSVIVVT